MKLKSIVLMGLAIFAMSCTPEKRAYKSFDEYPVPSAPINEMVYTPSQTTFTLWSPTAEQVELMLFDSGDEGSAYQSVTLEPKEDGLWSASVNANYKKLDTDVCTYVDLVQKKTIKGKYKINIYHDFVKIGTTIFEYQ